MNVGRKQKNFGRISFKPEAVLIPNPILKVLSTMQDFQVKCLLMGGQACVLYGAAEFSRDTDFVLLADEENLLALKQALDSLDAERIAVPPFEKKYLIRGHSIHFRCRHPDVAGLRVDVMSVMRGVDDFEVLWSRRTTVEINPGKRYEVLSLGDLVQAKKNAAGQGLADDPPACGVPLFSKPRSSGRRAGFFLAPRVPHSLNFIGNSQIMARVR
ncbi:hypothetical protein QQ054_10815 [Oscillatoria amoena NRMC-F 0135]|nr:hypothetical protein [Oscillatoria amoena NRMC-F 0135]